MLRKAIPVVLALCLGLAAGFVWGNPLVTSMIVSAIDRATAPRAKSEVVKEPVETSPPDLKDTLRELLKSKDVQSLIETAMSDPKIDIRAISDMVARQVAESPEMKKALAEQMKSQDARQVLAEMSRTKEFREIVLRMVQEPEVKKAIRSIVLESIKTEMGETPKQQSKTQ